MPGDSIGFGINGLGLIAPFHAKALKDSKGGRLAAVCDVMKDRADKMAAEYGVKAYYSLDEMLKDKSVDVVNVCTPSQMHSEAVMKSLNAGKHVLVEKPTALALKEVDAMVALAKQKKLKLGCVVQCRSRPGIQAIRKAVEAGRFGKVHWVSGYMKWFRPTDYYKSDAWRSVRRYGSGVTVNQAIHYIDLLTFLAGPVKSIDARMTNLDHPEIPLEDALIARIEYASGALGGFEASTSLWPGLEPRHEVLGRDGTAVIVGEAMQFWKFRTEQPGDDEVRKLGSSAQAAGATGAAAFGHHDHTRMIQDMIDCLNSGRELLVPVSTVRHTVEIVLAMYMSAKKKAPVEMPIKDDPSVWE
jgi:UDP-N-acetyl-2-amino-2-deoxyglucuronate dehydrogenase